MVQAQSGIPRAGTIPWTEEAGEQGGLAAVPFSCCSTFTRRTSRRRFFRADISDCSWFGGGLPCAADGARVSKRSAAAPSLTSHSRAQGALRRVCAAEPPNPSKDRARREATETRTSNAPVPVVRTKSSRRSRFDRNTFGSPTGMHRRQFSKVADVVPQRQGARRGGGRNRPGAHAVTGRISLSSRPFQEAPWQSRLARSHWWTLPRDMSGPRRCRGIVQADVDVTT